MATNCILSPLVCHLTCLSVDAVLVRVLKGMICVQAPGETAMIFCLRLSFDHLMTGSRLLLLPLGLKMVLSAHCQLQRKPPSSACSYLSEQVKQLRVLLWLRGTRSPPCSLLRRPDEIPFKVQTKPAPCSKLASKAWAVQAERAANRHFLTHVRQMWSARH